MVIGYDDKRELYFIYGQERSSDERRVLLYLEAWQVNDLIDSGIRTLRERKEFKEFILEGRENAKF